VADRVPITFLFTLGQRVRWDGDPQGRWRVIARAYEESSLSRCVRYQLRRLNDTEDTLAYEVDVAPLEDTDDAL